MSADAESSNAAPEHDLSFGFEPPAVQIETDTLTVSAWTGSLKGAGTPKASVKAGNRATQGDMDRVVGMVIAALGDVLQGIIPLMPPPPEEPEETRPRRRR